MGFKHIQVDMRDTHVKAVDRVEEALNSTVQKLEKSGFYIAEEEIVEENNSIKATFGFRYSKAGTKGIKYYYRVYDVRSGVDKGDNMLNELESKIEKEGYEILRTLTVQMSNSAFMQKLIVSAPKGKVKE